jgi:hypothetical protein
MNRREGGQTPEGVADSRKEGMRKGACRRTNSLGLQNSVQKSCDIKLLSRICQ